MKKSNKSKYSSLNLFRYFALSKKLKNMSLTRSLQYEKLEKLNFLGDLLDFGGGDNSRYIELLNCLSYNSVNIDSKIKPTWNISVNDAIPCKDKAFDTVISLNTIEHIFDAHYAISEMYRSLRPGGKLILTTPFLFYIHGHPDDYFRPTPSWYELTLSSIGFSNIKVESLWVGPFTTGSFCSGQPGPLKVFRMRCSILLDIVYHYFQYFFGKKNIEQESPSPLGLWVTAEKK